MPWTGGRSRELNRIRSHKPRPKSPGWRKRQKGDTQIRTKSIHKGLRSSLYY